MSSHKVELAGSYRKAPGNRRALNRVPEDDPITVSVYLRPREASLGGADKATSRASLREQREIDHVDDIAAVVAFAEASGLEVVDQDAGRRLVQLHGSALALERAFETELTYYESVDGAVYRGREGPLRLPADVAGRVTAVLGLDTRPIATPKIVPHPSATPPRGFLPTEVAALYGFTGVKAAGQCIAIIELGGGYTAADNEAAFQAMSLPVPEIVAVSVDGGTNNPADTSGANGEVALDIQVAGGVAQGAKLAVYFAPNTSQGFADAISQAAHDETNKPSTISISWGSAEPEWSAQDIAAMHQAFADAALLGVSVFAASGDNLAADGEKDGKVHADYPASDPLVIGCGGTRLDAVNGSISDEVVWNSNGSGTGGGVSALFAKPAYQAHAKVPKASTSTGGRGVPDVAGDADPDSGYRIVTDGKLGLYGGTSAVAPLWAGIVAGLNAGRTEPLGDLHAKLYGAPGVLRDITHGNNHSGKVGYSAAKGWDPCTGLGTPIGAKLRELFK